MIVSYVVYDASGEIKRSGNCPKRLLVMQAREGEYVIHGDVADDLVQVVMADESGVDVVSPLPLSAYSDLAN